MTILKKISFLFFITLGVLSGCGGSSGSATTSLTGTAATGAAIEGTVTLKDALGAIKTITTTSDGSFTFDSTGMTAPFLLKIVPDGNGETLFSHAAAAQQTVNITPLTNLALFLANQSAAVSALYDNWSATSLSANQILEHQSVINANLRSQLITAGLNETSYNFFTEIFKTDGTGIDSILDLLTINVIASQNSLYSILVSNNANYLFDPNIDISAINLGGGGTGGGNDETTATIPASIAGTYDLKYSETKTGSGIAADTSTTFIVGADGTLTIDAGIVLTDPVVYKGNLHEAIWFDNANNLSYALSSLVTGFNEINVGTNVFYDQAGYMFYGQYRKSTGGDGGGGDSDDGVWNLVVTVTSPVFLVVDVGGDFATPPNLQQVSEDLSSQVVGATNVVVTPTTDTDTTKEFTLTYTLQGVINYAATYTYTKS